jgi:hypothetical protein
VDLTDNAAATGGGLRIEGSAALGGCRVLRNQGHGALVADGGTLSSITGDWGDGADDNQPGDVFAGATVSGWGAAATFDCTSGGCDPAP